MNFKLIGGDVGCQLAQGPYSLPWSPSRLELVWSEQETPAQALSTI